MISSFTPHNAHFLATHSPTPSLPPSPTPSLPHSPTPSLPHPLHPYIILIQNQMISSFTPHNAHFLATHSPTPSLPPSPTPSLPHSPTPSLPHPLHPYIILIQNQMISSFTPHNAPFHATHSPTPSLPHSLPPPLPHSPTPSLPHPPPPLHYPHTKPNDLLLYSP